MLKENLIKCRRMNGWTQQDLAEKSGFSRSSIINWETGKRAPRSIDIEKLANILGTSTAYLMGEINVSNNKHSDAINNLALPEYTHLNKLPDNFFSYWGGILDEVKKVIKRNDLEEINLIMTFFKPAYEMLVKIQKQVKQNNTSEFKDKALEQHIDVHDNQMEADNINIGTISSDNDKNGDIA